MADLNLIAAFGAGFLSFLSPCVLPLIPGYISFISGLSLGDLQGSDEGGAVVRRAFLSSLWFVFGFSAVFVALGASATAVGVLLLERLDLFRWIAGALIILFGIHLTGIIRIPFLQYEKKIDVRQRPLSAVGAFLVGAAFAFGWTPCIGPILAGILGLAATQETVGKGMLLLLVYSAGLGIPFLLTSLGVAQFMKWFARFRRYLRIVEIFSGVLLIVIGLFIVTDRLSWLARYLTMLDGFSK